MVRVGSRAVGGGQEAGKKEGGGVAAELTSWQCHCVLVKQRKAAFPAQAQKHT